MVCFGICIPAKVESGFSVCCAGVVDGISIWGSGMTVSYGFLDAGGPEVDVVGTDGCGDIGSGATGGLGVLSRGLVVVAAMRLGNGRV